MKLVVYDPSPDADNINPVSVPAIGKVFAILGTTAMHPGTDTEISGDPQPLTDEDAAIVLTNPHFRLADSPATKAAPAAVKPPESGAAAQAAATAPPTATTSTEK